MNDQTPSPSHDNDAAAPEPGLAHSAAATTPAPGLWFNRRVPLLIAGAALLLGCMLGGGVVAIGALVTDGDRGGHSSRDGRADDNSGGARHKGNRGGDGRTGNDQSTPPPSTSAPAPTPSA